MKYLLLISAFCFSLHAKNIEKDVDAILQSTMSFSHMDMLLPMLVGQALENGEKTMDSELLLAKLQEQLKGPEFSNHFYPFFEKTFTPKEIKKLREIYEDETYIKMQQQGMEFGQMFIVAINDLIGDIVNEHGQIKPKPVVQSESRVMSVTAESFKNEVELFKGRVIIDVYADWCGPCKKLKPIFDDLSNEYTSIKFVKINYEDAKDLLKRFNVSSLPTILFVKDGEVVGRHVGLIQADGLKAKIKEVFN